MNTQNFTIEIEVNKSPKEAFDAINNVRGWWSGDIQGNTTELGGEFVYTYKDLHRSVQKITELISDQKVVWHVTDGYLSFVKHSDEWKGTDIVFEIVQKDTGSHIKFTHIGLLPENECYGSCSSGWTALIGNNLKNLIETGQPQPNPFE